jgi:hypothetical protein
VIQSKIGTPYENMFIVLRNIYIERGHTIRSIYKGVWPNAIRAFFSWGIMNAAYESIKKVVY